MHTLVRKLAALSVEKYYMTLTEIQLKIRKFHGSFSQKGSRPLSNTMKATMPSKDLAKHARDNNGFQFHCKRNMDNYD